MRTADFDYLLPPDAIAQSAVEPRDAARLLVGSTLEDLRFSDLPRLVRPGDLFVVNRTRVRAARLAGVKQEGGGAIEMLLTKRLEPRLWQGLIRPARRIRPGTVIRFGPVAARILAGPERGVVTAEFDAGDDDLDDLLADLGSVPLPPYFTGTLDDPERYQTIFAERPGSAAASTAALHFTPQLVERVRAAGGGFAAVDLEIGLDTFRPIAAEHTSDHRMHRERYLVPDATAAAVRETRSRPGRVVAVGTTVVRTLEAATGPGGIAPGAGETDLFITPGYRFRTVDALITNFHAPRTTLIALVAAFAGEPWRRLYRHALDNGYRFLSFGDAMFLERS